MRAQCCVCTDLFEYSVAAKPIAASPCGHTFHDECLTRWMKSSSTCPSCRTHVKKSQIIKRLYFDIQENESDTPDGEEICRLTNQVGNLKAEVLKAEKDRDVLAQRFYDSEREKNETITKMNIERNKNEILCRDLKHLTNENATLEEGLKDYKRTQELLQTFRTVERILKGCDSDIQAMISQYSEGGESSLRQLCSLATVMKREYTNAVADRKNYKDQLNKMKNLYLRLKSEKEKIQQEFNDVKANLEEANSSLSQVEKENNQNRRKLAHLRTALRHNVRDGNDSFVKALNEDSPNVAFTPPKLTSIEATPSRKGLVNLNSDKSPCPQTPTSPDLFDTSQPEEDIENHKRPFPGQTSPKLKFVQVTTESEKIQAAKKLKTENLSDDVPPPPVLNILKKKLTGISNSRSHVPSVSRHGYDGFGGSTTFVQPVGPSKISLGLSLGNQKKKVIKNKNIRPANNQPNILKSFSQMTSSSSMKPVESCDTNVGLESKNAWKGPFAMKVKKKSQSHIASSSSSCPRLTADESDFVDLT